MFFLFNIFLFQNEPLKIFFSSQFHHLNVALCFTHFIVHFTDRISVLCFEPFTVHSVFLQYFSHFKILQPGELFVPSVILAFECTSLNTFYLVLMFYSMLNTSVVPILSDSIFSLKWFAQNPGGGGFSPLRHFNVWNFMIGIFGHIDEFGRRN